MSRKRVLDQGRPANTRSFLSQPCRTAPCHMQTCRGSSLGELLIKAEDYPLRGSGSHVGTQIRAELSWHLGICVCPATLVFRVHPLKMLLFLALAHQMHSPRGLRGTLHPWVGRERKIIFMRTTAVPAKFKIKEELITSP